MIAAIERLLHERTGLDVSTVGQSTVERAVRKRMKACDIAELKSYADLLETSNVEMMSLIDEVVIPETWFFRDSEPFAALSDYIRTEWIPARHPEPLRVLSVPCSTGEEAYSIAIVLYEAGLKREEGYVDAVDISHRSIEAAKRGTYGPHSFREKRYGLREYYFQAQDGLNSLIDPVRRMVEFHYGNLLEPYTLPSQGPYHVVFCRNLLIYFDKATQQRAARILNGLLATGGLLFLGHAETGPFLDGDMTPLGRRGSFAYRKFGAQARNAAPSQPPRRPSRKQRPRQSGAPAMDPYASPREPVPPPAVGGGDRPHRDRLKEVAALADRGRLEEAVALCEAYLREDRESAQAYYLLGVLSESAGDGQRAERMLRKAVYLEPEHEEALAHLSLLAERNGDVRAAEAFRRRMKRIAERAAAEKAH